MLAITVQTTTATDADAFSTACYVLGLRDLWKTIKPPSAPSGKQKQETWPSRVIVVTESERAGGVTMTSLPADRPTSES
jgi:hypothetical protein